ncbi:MAG TPA: transglutaminase-like cysteine peptidase [Rhizomicrobium sp.]|nr:transglutaminase-like cysteine peptidase [Rhizomicrobium sp.]
MTNAGKTKQRIVRLGASLGLCLISACCSASEQTPPLSTAMQSGAPVPPPLGYMDFCQRHIDQCGPHAKALMASGQMGNGAPLTVVDMRGAPASVQPAVMSRASGASQGYNWGLVFASARLLSEAQVSNRKQTQVPTVESREAGQSAPVLSPAMWHTLEDVNQYVNGRVRQRSDTANYGVADYWELPLESGNGAGDCEDYALEKRKLLADKGIPENALSIALVQTGWGEAHAVLLVRTDKGDYVLDNLSSWIQPWKDVSYTWLERQSNWDPDVWVRVAQE